MRTIQRNRVPAAPIVEIINVHLAEVGQREAEGTFTKAAIYPLAERADVRGDTLHKIIQGRSATIDFDVADRLLCVMNMSDLWRTDLKEIYESVWLDDRGSWTPSRASGAKVCARVGCSVLFMQPKRCPPKMYCSSTCCAAAAWQRKHGVKTQPRGKDRALEKLVCRNGHERTPENTGWNGVANFCLICKRKTNREYRQRRKQRKQILVAQ